MLKIINAIYGTLESSNKVDVTDILSSRIVNNTLDVSLSNGLFTDPNNGVAKECYIKYEINGEIREIIKPENTFIHLPESNFKSMPVKRIEESSHNVLLITSCNRIKQTLLALSLNYQTINKPFSVIIMDSSTPYSNQDEVCRKLQSEDVYNKVNANNYCSDINLLYEAKKYFPLIENYKVIHCNPRLPKQEGESTLIGLGLTQAALIGNKLKGKQNYCLKLTGTSILKYDALTPLKDMLTELDVVTWHRSNIGGYERSTRIFGCKPETLASLIINEGWQGWCSDNEFFEYKFAKLINTKIPDRINYTQKDDGSVLLEGGSDLEWSDPKGARNRILEFIETNNINKQATPYLVEFINGGIYP